MTNHTDASEEPLVNLSELLARVDNDRELLLDLISIFKEEFPAYVRSLEAAMGRKNFAEIASVSHTLKGMLSNLAVGKASVSAGRLEQLARAADAAAIQDAFRAFEQDVRGLLPEMESYMAEARP